MPEREGAWTPITEARSERVRFNHVLPQHVDATNITVNMRRIERLCKIGGIEILVISGVDGDQSATNIVIVGNNQQGGAYAGKVISKTEAQTIQTSKTNNNNLLHPARSVDANLNLNLQAIYERIQQDSKIHYPRSPEAWSRHLDAVIRQGIRKVGLDHLTNINVQDWKASIGSMLAVAIILYAPHISARMKFVSGQSTLPELIAFGLLSIQTLRFFQANVENENPGEPIRLPRLSTFLGPELDRAVILWGLSHTQRLIRPINKPKT